MHKFSLGALVKFQSPQTFNGKGLSIFTYLADQITLHVENSNSPVAKITYQQKLFKSLCFSYCQTPGRIKCSLRCKAPDEHAFRRKNIYITVAGPCLVVMFIRFLQGIGYIQHTINILNTEWCKI